MPEQIPSKLHHPDSSASTDIHLLDVLVVIAQHKKVVLVTPVVLGSLALAASLLMTPIFSSTAKVMPPQQQSSSMSAVLGQLGGLAGAAGGIPGLKSPTDLYVGLLESRTIADRLIARFKLQQRYNGKNMDEARATLAANTVAATGKKDGFITITVKDPDASFAADLANAYVDELIKLSQNMALTEASQRRVFFEKQLEEARDHLASAEIALRNTQQKTGMVQPEAQVQSIIASAAQVKGTIAAKEVELNGLRTFATGRNPDLLRGEQELRGLQSQLMKIENNSGPKAGSLMAGAGKIPEVAVEYVRRVRDVKYYETMFELLAKQFEVAKIDEAKDSSLIQLLDKAIPADHKSTPRRALITLAGLIAGLALGILSAFLKAAYIVSNQDPKNRKQWSALRAAFGRGRVDGVSSL